LVSLVVFIVLVVGGIGFLLSRLRTQPKAHQRTPILQLAYCNSNNLKPCIVSFSLDADGRMLVNLLTPSKTYPDFYLTISNNATKNRYECQQVEDFPTNVYCIGTEMYPGETLQFTINALEDDQVLAEGEFTIIGLQLPNPADETTATPSVTETPAETEPPFETPTPFLLELPTPLPTISSPTKSSYPNYP